MDKIIAWSLISTEKYMWWKKSKAVRHMLTSGRFSDPDYHVVSQSHTAWASPHQPSLQTRDWITEWFRPDEWASPPLTSCNNSYELLISANSGRNEIKQGVVLPPGSQLHLLMMLTSPTCLVLLNPDLWTSDLGLYWDQISFWLPL